MPAKKESWIAKYENNKACQQWLVDHPPPEGWHGTPMEYAFDEGPIDFPLDVPDGEEEPITPPEPLPAAADSPVTRREHDALREQVARVAKGFNRAIKKKRAQVTELPPAPPAPVPAPAAAPRRGLAAILEPLKRKA